MPAVERPPRTARRTLAGLVLAALLSFGLSGYLAVRLPPFFAADERAHFSYSVMLLDGHLPRITEHQPFTDRYPIIERSLDPPGPTPPRRQGMFVATHPPLTYVVAAPAVWIAGHAGSDALPTLAFRLVNAVSMAVAVVLAGLVAAELFPRQRGIAVSAALLTAVVPTLVAVAAKAQNDGPALALTTACLLVGTRMLRRGVSGGRLVAACLVAGAALATRASAAVAVAALAACAATAVWQHRDRGRDGAGAGRRRMATAARAAGAALAVTGTALVASGWFYWRNQRLYGSPTADSFLLEGLKRVDQGTVADALRNTGYHREMWTGLYGVVHPYLSVWHPGRILAGIAGVTFVGLGLAAVRGRRGRGEQADDPAASADPTSGIGTAGWVIMGAFSAGVVFTAARFYADGGGPHPRYLLSVVPLVSALVARAVAELPWPRLALAAVVGAELATIASQFTQYDGLVGNPDFPPRPFVVPSAGLVAQRAALALAVAAGAALVALLVDDWWRRRATRAPTA